MDRENKYVYPSPYVDHDGDDCHYRGLTKREYMATQILAGMSSKVLVGGGMHTIGLIRAAVIMADQLLIELENEPT